MSQRLRGDHPVRYATAVKACRGGYPAVGIGFRITERQYGHDLQHSIGTSPAYGSLGRESVYSIFQLDSCHYR